MCSPRQGLGFLPALLGALMLLSIVTTYIVAAMNGHVEAFFPYISDTGASIPESCIFSQFFNLAAMLGVIVMFLRFKLIQGITGDQDPTIRILSRLNLVFAILSCLGLSMVANFQETSIEPAHLTGAMLVFGLGVGYAFVDAVITYRMCPEYNGRVIYRARFLVAALGLISLITSIVTGAISRNQWAKNPPSHTRLHWEPTDPGYTAHLVSTFGEWALAASFLFYYITFIRDFQRFTITVTPILYVSHLDETPRGPSEPPSPRVLVTPEERPEPNERTRLIA